MRADWLKCVLPISLQGKSIVNITREELCGENFIYLKALKKEQEIEKRSQKADDKIGNKGRER